jgi:hypothetical protein
MLIQDETSDAQAEQVRLEVARRIAAELQEETGRCRPAKVSSLLHAFRSSGVHCDIGDVKRALTTQGVRWGEDQDAISRRDVLDLHLMDGSADQPATGYATPGIRMSSWTPGLAGSPQPLGQHGQLETPGQDEVRWFDVDPGSHEPTSDDVERVLGALKASCPELNKVIVRDLLTPDSQPKAEIYGDEATGIRTVSVAALIAREVPDDDDDFDERDEQLLVQMVELVIGPNWLITCWHPGKSLNGGGVVTEGPRLLLEPFLSYVSHLWVEGRRDAPAEELRPQGGNDLAAYLTKSLVATYGASLRMLQRWVSSWEAKFFQTIGIPDDQTRTNGQATKVLQAAAVEISNFLSVVGEFSRSVNALKLAGEEMPNSSWFAQPHPTVGNTPRPSDFSDQVDDITTAVETAVTKTGQLSEEIRADMDLLMLHSQARQQETSERLQGYLGKVTGLILVPSFVAGLFGANTALPEGCTWTGFVIMVVLMVVSAAASYWFIRRLMR